MAKKTSQYKVVIERDEDGFFVASVPALPGCHTQAKDISDLMERVRDAIRLCLEVSRENPQYRAKVKRFAYEPTFVGMDVVVGIELWRNDYRCLKQGMWRASCESSVSFLSAKAVLTNFFNIPMVAQP